MELNSEERQLWRELYGLWFLTKGPFSIEPEYYGGVDISATLDHLIDAGAITLRYTSDHSARRIYARITGVTNPNVGLRTIEELMGCAEPRLSHDLTGTSDGDREVGS